MFQQPRGTSKNTGQGLPVELVEMSATAESVKREAPSFKAGRFTKLTDLEFYVPIWNFSDKRDTTNIFGSSRVLYSVACYRTGRYAESVEAGMKDDWCLYCFGDLWSRIEWEFGFGAPFKKDDGSWVGEKVDVYTVFVKPNEKLLRQMIDEVSVESCREWLEQYRKQRRIVSELGSFL